MSQEIVSVKTFFNSINVHLLDVWLERCVNWCKSEILTSNYTQEELQLKVFEQWLLLDLRELEVSVLPPDLSNKEKYTLNGNFCLQMMQVVDISKPKLWQLQKIRNSNLLTRNAKEDADVAGTGKRMLQLTLTDGVQTVEAMEYRPISCLSINLSPGIKIRIVGPVVVRRGRLMLEQQNVVLLGGEVEDVLVVNAAENVLARALKLQENPNPGKIEEKVLAVEQEEKNEGFSSAKKINKRPACTPAPPQEKVKKAETVITLDDDDEIFISDEIDMLLEVEAEHRQQQQQQQPTVRNTPDIFEDSDFNADFDDFENIPSSTQMYTKQNTNSVKKPPQPAVHLDDDVFDEIDIDAQFAIAEKQATIQSPKLKPKIITIEKILKIQNETTQGTFRIKAKFKEVVEKLTFGENEYKIVIKVEDSSGELVVCVHSDIISEFAGYNPAEITSLKSRILNRDEAATDKVMKAIQKVRDKLLKLDNEMVVKVERHKMPVVIKII